MTGLGAERAAADGQFRRVNSTASRSACAPPWGQRSRCSSHTAPYARWPSGTGWPSGTATGPSPNPSGHTAGPDGTPVTRPPGPGPGPGTLRVGVRSVEPQSRDGGLPRRRSGETSDRSPYGVITRTVRRYLPAKGVLGSPVRPSLEELRAYRSASTRARGLRRVLRARRSTKPRARSGRPLRTSRHGAVSGAECTTWRSPGSPITR